MNIAHYIFVRRDLPLGVIAAMVTHAAGESAPLYQDENGHFRGATAVVLEAKDEAHLHKISEYLWYHDLDKVEIYESSEPYANQLMAIGLVPLERTDQVRELLGEFQTLKSCLDNTPTQSVKSLNTNETDKNEGAKETPDLGHEGLLGRDCCPPESGC